MRTVYRYEDCAGRGPYRSYRWKDTSVVGSLAIAHSDEDHLAWERSVLTEDGLLTYEVDVPGGRDWLAACDSRESLNAWFEGFAEVLAENGFTIREYTVPDENVVDSQSGRQCAFLPVDV